jgi:hypothetical protein
VIVFNRWFRVQHGHRTCSDVGDVGGVMQDLHPSASQLNLDLATFSNLSGKTFDSETRTKHYFPFLKKTTTWQAE